MNFSSSANHLRNRCMAWRTNAVPLGWNLSFFLAHDKLMFWDTWVFTGQRHYYIYIFFSSSEISTAWNIWKSGCVMACKEEKNNDLMILALLSLLKKRDDHDQHKHNHPNCCCCETSGDNLPLDKHWEERKKRPCSSCAEQFPFNNPKKKKKKKAAFFPPLVMQFDNVPPAKTQLRNAIAEVVYTVCFFSPPPLFLAGLRTCLPHRAPRQNGDLSPRCSGDPMTEQHLVALLLPVWRIE